MKRFDIFGKALQVKFQGADQYQTKVGGFISILVCLVMVSYGSQKVVKLVTRGDPEITFTHKFLNMRKTKLMNLGENRFNMITLVKSTNPTTGEEKSVDVPSDIGHFRMVSLDPISDRAFDWKARLIKRINCSKDFKGFKSKLKVADHKSKYAKCFDLNTEHAVIGGNFESVVL